MLLRHILLFQIFSFNSCTFPITCEDKERRTQLKRIKRQSFGGFCSPQLVFNGQVNYVPTSNNLGQITSGTSAVLVCNAGFYPSGSSSATCNNGVWSQTLGICQSTTGGIGIGSTLTPGITTGFGQCTAMIPPAFGQLNYINAGQPSTTGLQQQQLGPFPSGTTVQLICLSGTFATGSSQAVCQNGQWQPFQLGPCQSTGLGVTGSIGGIGGCMGQMVPANGQILYSTVLQPGQTTYPSGTTATLSCFSGIPPINGQSTSSCLNGMWSPALGICSITGGTQGIFPTAFTGIGSTCPFGLFPPIGGTIQYSGQQQQQSFGSITGPPYAQGTTATLICQQGVPTGQSTSVCTGGQWMPPSLSGCSSGGLFGVTTPSIIGGFGTTAGQCVLPLTVLGGTVFYSNSGTTGGISNTGTLVGSVNTNIGTSQIGPWPQGTIAQAQCTNGQIPTGGPTSATCINSQWQPAQLGSCLGGGIGTVNPFGSTLTPLTGQGTCLFGPLTPLNGRLQFSNGQTIGPFPAGTTATLLCNAGFIPNGLSTSTCMNSQFSALGQCMPSSSNPIDTSTISNDSSNIYNSARVQCFELPQPANRAQFIYSPPSNSSSFPIGTTATLVCSAGTQLSDGSTHDPDAHSLFVRINRAYEVLKDDDLRQKYDQFGEKGLEDNGGGDHQYQSWQFYNDNFGIYDEDPEIITLGRGDFEEEVFQSGEIWFVNFYSAYCSHCHTLAPVWRELAKRIPEGVARIGAVNCAEDPQLCRSQNVMGYPSLIVYPQQEWFEGERKLDNLLNFLLSQISISILQPTHALPPQRPLLLELCLFNENDCLSEEERKKIAAISNQLLIQFVLLDCSDFAKELCNTFGAQEGMFLLSGDENEKPKELYFADLTDLRLQLLSELPELDELTSIEFNQLLNRKNINTDQESTLIIFINSKEEEQKEWRRLPIIFPQLDVKIVNCFVKDIKHLCDNMHLGKLPRSAIFKSNGGYDLNYGLINYLIILGNVQTNIREIIKFIRHSLNSNLIVLNYDTYWVIYLRSFFLNNFIGSSTIC
ncbi:hypothetical protein Mgra_00000750 [Meloidogyne graminicola]|uniref:DnaJ homolog subfamily C member 16 n=1 Tax=Meloidogyne graminicola TaxID=189291 RepID=A0A8T0A2P8_9BILA|nr:hypothetical protein Mgra_00000750 [Meloidogyne graminicola]